MNIYEFILAMGFWQWCGFLTVLMITVVFPVLILDNIVVNIRRGRCIEKAADNDRSNPT